MRCVALIEGCRDCQVEGDWKQENGHECGSEDHRWHRWCDIQREARMKSVSFHLKAHEPVRCEGCDLILWDLMDHDVTVTRPCPSGCCRELVCPDCETVWMSDGPVDCPSCGSDPRRSETVRRMRQDYRRKRAAW